MDEREIAAQVRIMRFIYRLSREVVVGFSPADEYTNIAFEMLRKNLEIQDLDDDDPYEPKISRLTVRKSFSGLGMRTRTGWP